MQPEGIIWEDRAAAFLQSRGLTIIDRNFQCRSGELDIVALDQGCLVFVEVRKRQRSRFTSASASVDGRKQRRLQRAALYFMKCHPKLGYRSCRFDVIAWDIAMDTPPRPRWLRGAIPGF